MPAKELVDAYHSAGFTGIAITDHVCQHYCTSNWETSVKDRMRGYKAAKKRGDEIGLDVVLGIELRFNISWSDYLIYGIDEDFLLANPHPYRLTPQEFYRRHGGDVLIIQAHPYRDICSAPLTDCIHGFEVFNGNARHNNNDKKVFKLCKKHPDLYQINSSDAHEPQDVGREWIMLEERAIDSFSFKEIIASHRYELERIPRG